MLNRRGFTLVETVISIAIMALVIVNVLGVFAIGNNAIKKSKSIVTATNVAEKKIAEIKNFCTTYKDYNVDITDTDISDNISGNNITINPVPPFKLWQSPPAPMTATSIYGIEKIDNVGDFKFEIEINDYIDSSLITVYDIKKVMVTVKWIDPPSMEEKKSSIITLIAKE